MKEDAPELRPYYEEGCRIVSGHLSANAAAVVFDEHAEDRMKERDIDESEVLKVLANARSSHRRGKKPGRFEVVGETDRGSVCVIYEHPYSDVVVVITTYVEQL